MLLRVKARLELKGPEKVSYVHLQAKMSEATSYPRGALMNILKPLFVFIFSVFLMLNARGEYIFDQEHSNMTLALSKVVAYKEYSGSVKYKDLIKKPTDLINYLKDIGRVSEKEFKTWNETNQIAFLINVYNANSLQLVKDYYPIATIKKVPGTKDAMKMRFFRLFGRDMSLDALQTNYLRKNYSEPRYHFALNCATVACPRLRNEAYVGARLSEQLDDQVKTFLRDTSRNKIDLQQKNLQLSPVLQTVAVDLQRDGITVGKWVAPYISDDEVVRKELTDGKYKVSHLDYDWDLNKE